MKKILEKINQWFFDRECRRIARGNTMPRLYDGLRNTWGHSFVVERGGHVSGFRRHRPRPGDLVLLRHRSNGIGRFLIVGVELCRDPDDMFFADVVFDGMEDEKSRYQIHPVSPEPADVLGAVAGLHR